VPAGEDRRSGSGEPGEPDPGSPLDHARFRRLRPILPGRRALTWGLLALLAAAGLYFAYRGPYRALAGMDGRDLTVFYTATRAWIDGTDPYDRDVLAGIATQAGIRIEPTWSLNPPTTFVILTPLAILPWPVAETASVVTNVLLAAACVAMAMSLAGLSLRQPRGVLFAALAVGLAPFHTAISEGQLTIAATALILAALLAEERDRPVTAGVCIALAAGLKPQVGLIFLLLLLLRGQWRALGAAAATLGAIAAIGIARLDAHGVDWAPTLLANLTDSGLGDATVATTQRLNLQALLNVLVAGNGPLINLLTLGFAVASTAVLFVALRKRTDREADLLLYAGCAVITLLSVYNRSYGATLLLLPLAWACSPLRPRVLAPAAIVVVVATAVFLVPGAAALARSHAPGVVGWLQPWWPFVQLHQVLALLAILGCLLLAAGRRVDAPGAAPEVGPGPSPGRRAPLPHPVR
jgi:hypothetical protein